VFPTLALAEPARLVPIRALTARPGTVNEPLATLHDGKLAANYGPVFGNDTGGGSYKVDLGAAREIAAVGTWSYHQNGNRGAQFFVLYGATTDADPGWDVVDGKTFTPLVTVQSQCTGRFHATRVQPSTGASLGRFRWLVWAVLPVTPIGENTAFQELQVVAG
jgi:hypothetical protein